MRVVLLNLPVGGSIAQPYSSIAYLAGSLRAAGFDVIQRDLNLDAADHFLTPTYLGRARNRLKRLVSAPDDASDDAAALSAGAKSRYRRKLIAEADELISGIEAAKASLRSELDFFDRERYEVAARSITRAYELIQEAYWPAHVSAGNYCPTPYGLDSSEGLRHLFESRSETPLSTFWAEDVLPWLNSVQPDLIGLSVTFAAQLQAAVELCGRLRDGGSTAHVVAGGGHLTAIADYFEVDSVLFEAFDTMVVGEGESAIVGLAEWCARGGPSSEREQIPNTVFREDDAVRSGPKLQEDLSRLPPPDFSPAHDWKYLAPHPTFLLTASRGCFAQCAFCAVAIYNRDVKSDGKPYRVDKMDHLIEVIRSLVDQNEGRTTYLYFSDDVIAVPWLARMADRILAEGLGPTVRWICDSRLDKGFTPEVAAKLYDAGCREIFFGMESGSQRVLDLMGKGTRLDMMSEAIRNLGEANVGVFLSLIVGFPGETEAEALETLDFVIRHRKHVFTAQFGPFVLVKDSPAWLDPERWGVSFEPSPHADLQLTWFDYAISSGMNHRQAHRLTALIRRRFSRACPTLCDEVNGFNISFDARSLLYLDHYGLGGLKSLVESPHHVESTST